MKVLHTIQHGPFAKKPESFFIPGEENQLFIIGSNEKNQIRQKDILSIRFIRTVLSHDLWIIHRYYNEFGPIIRLVKSRTKVVIQTWGKDYLIYNEHQNFLLPVTKKYTQLELMSNGFTLKETENTTLSKLRIPKTNVVLKPSFQPAFHLAHKVLFCAPHENIKELGFDQHGKLCRFLYDTLPKPTPPKEHRSSPITVQIGHNGNEFNNHLDAFHCLHPLFDLHQFFLPLSYGGSKRYLEQLINIAPDSCFIQDTNLPLSDYLLRLETIDTYCSFALRQTGLGNLFTHVLLGHSILVHSKGIQALLLKQAGLQFLTESDIPNGKLTMSIESRIFNQSRVEIWFEQIRAETDRLIKEILA